MAKLTCYGGAGNTTGANFLLEINNRRVLIDCGMEQGAGDAETHNRKPFEYDPASIEMLFVTHAHIDHIGLIPKLWKEGFRGKIYSTQETREISELLLLDAAKIGREEETELYTQEDVFEATKLWHTLSYHANTDFKDFSIELFDAGHVLGSSMIKFTFPSGKTMLFTGDLGNSPSPLLRDVEKIAGLDYLLMESVYGDRNHEDRALREEKFMKVVKESMERKGVLLIPAFSLERTQEIVSLLDDLFENKKLPAVPVFLDSPLAIKITAIYEKVSNQFNQEKQTELKEGDDLFNFKRLRETPHFQDAQVIGETQGPKIIIAGSGMSTAGRIVGHEIKYLPDPKNTILFMGYQVVGTPGRQIAEGVKRVMIKDQMVEVKAKVERIDGFSGHADSNALVDFVSHSAPTLKKVFVAMGEPKSSIFLAQRLRDEFDIDAIATEEGKSYEVEV